MLLRYLTRSNLDRDVPISIDAIHRSFVGDAFIQGDGFRVIVMLHGFIKESPGGLLIPLCRQQEINRLALLVYGTIQIFSDAFDLDISLIHAPASTGRAFVLAKDFFE
jgi:hypothetical protein